jgi:CD109 antigen
VSNDLTFAVRTNKPIAGATYQILGKGKVLDSKFIKAQNSDRFEFSVKPTMDMLPTAKVLVFYIEDSGEIISDYTAVEFGNQLKNFVRIEIFSRQVKIIKSSQFQVDIKLSKNQTEPGKNVTLNIKTLPNSFVGLLGVDQSVLILKSGNDINKQIVFSELMQYDYANTYNNYYNNDGNFDYRYYQDFGSTDNVVITNAKPPFRKISFGLEFALKCFFFQNANTSQSTIHQTLVVEYWILQGEN